MLLILSIKLESQMMSSPATRLDIPVTHSLKSWMGNTGISWSWSRDPVLVSNEFTKNDKGKKRIKIVQNMVLPGGWVIAVFWTGSRSDWRELKQETRKKRIMKVG